MSERNIHLEVDTGLSSAVHRLLNGARDNLDRGLVAALSVRINRGMSRRWVFERVLSREGRFR